MEQNRKSLILPLNDLGLDCSKLRALILLIQTLVLYKSFTYLLTYRNGWRSEKSCGKRAVLTETLRPCNHLIIWVSALLFYTFGQSFAKTLHRFADCFIRRIIQDLSQSNLQFNNVFRLRNQLGLTHMVVKWDYLAAKNLYHWKSGNACQVNIASTWPCMPMHHLDNYNYNSLEDKINSQQNLTMTIYQQIWQ